MEPITGIMLILNVAKTLSPIILPQLISIAKNVKGITSMDIMTLDEFEKEITAIQERVKTGSGTTLCDVLGFTPYRYANVEPMKKRRLKHQPQSPALLLVGEGSREFKPSVIFAAVNFKRVFLSRSLSPCSTLGSSVRAAPFPYLILSLSLRNFSS